MTLHLCREVLLGFRQRGQWRGYGRMSGMDEFQGRSERNSRRIQPCANPRCASESWWGTFTGTGHCATCLHLCLCPRGVCAKERFLRAFCSCNTGQSGDTPSLIKSLNHGALEGPFCDTSMNDSCHALPMDTLLSIEEVVLSSHCITGGRCPGTLRRGGILSQGLVYPQVHSPRCRSLLKNHICLGSS